MTTSVDALPSLVPADILAARRRNRQIALLVFTMLLVAAFVVGREVPGWLDLGVQKWSQDRYKWTVFHRDTSPIFTWFLNPISDFLTWSVDKVLSLLNALRWPGVVALTAAVGWRTGGPRVALAGGLAMFGVGVVADWNLAMVTLAIMTVAVVIALVLGIPLGILSARSDRFERGMRVVLDTAQVMPAFVYFSPLVVMLGIRYPPGVAATVVYALPPAVRLTNLGLRQVPVVVNEVGESFGATRRQQLFKVQLPMARRTILLGLNQVIMMAFAIVVLASLLGTGDLGQVVLSGLQKNDVGAMASAGLGIVLMAVALDRVTTGERGARIHWLPKLPQLSRRAVTWAAVAVFVAAVVAARVFSWKQWPSALTYDIGRPVNHAVHWVQDNLRNGVPIIGGTQTISDGLTRWVLNPLRDLLLNLPWLVVVVALAFVGWLSKGWRLALTVAACLVAVAMMGTIPGGGGRIQVWDKAMDTLSQVIVAIVLAVGIALPLGIWAGRSDRVERALRPFLDAAQVLPQFVYLIPVVFLFSVGRAAGVVACVVYAIPPCIRLTALGMREVPTPPREAAISFGATGSQEMRLVQLPLARRAIMLGINQTVMMVLATVIIAALVGAGALGLVAYEAFTKPLQKLGQGVAGGLAIVFLAIMLDRLSQAWGRDPDGSRS